MTFLLYLALSLPRLQTRADLREAVRQSELTRIPDRPCLVVDGSIRQKGLDYAREEAQEFLWALSRAYCAYYSNDLTVTSAVRTEEYQRQLRRRNGNAAPVHETTHVTGNTVDISYRRLTKSQRHFVETFLEAAPVHYVKERRQPVYHIEVGGQ